MYLLAAWYNEAREFFVRPQTKVFQHLSPLSRNGGDGDTGSACCMMNVLDDALSRSEELPAAR